MNDSQPLDDPQARNMGGCATFLTSLFDNLDGFIEVRVIEDKKGGNLVERRWYETATSLVDDLGRLKAVAADRNGAIFFGVLPRRARGKGKSQDVMDGLVTWVDIDFKDFDGGEKEARERLATLPLQPSIVVRSGHGLHLYWVVCESTDPAELSKLAKALARVLGGDHAFDAARILRLPGTYNRKEPDKPILVEIESIEPKRAYNVSEIEDALDLVGWDPTSESTTASSPVQVDVGDRMSDRVLALLDSNKRVGALFNGRGKPSVGADGRRTDTSSSGYDFSFVLELARVGVDDPSELATALSCRPDGAAKEKGDNYLARTVAAALDRAQRATDTVASVVDFEVESVRILSSDRSTYELTIRGQKLHVTSAQLRSMGSFATRYLQVLHRIPGLPEKAEEWHAYVNSLLERAEVVDLGQDASETAALRVDVETALQELQQGEEVEDLDRGLSLVTDGQVGFKVDPLLKHLQEQRPDLKRHGLCAVLRDLGHKSATRRFEGNVVRLWI